MKLAGRRLFIAIFMVAQMGFSQKIASEKVIKIENLSEYLTGSVLEKMGGKSKVNTDILAQYFREKFSERFYYNWKSFDARFAKYKAEFESSEGGHEDRAIDHMNKYAAITQWKLPFDYLNGNPVDSYALRHLARQHKMVDVALQYFYKGDDLQYLDYFTNQMKSLNSALELGDYESIEDGNGVYEAFRSGYRVLNWLRIHNMFLGESGYSDEEQLTTIATLLQHGAHLYKNNQSFKSGNHQTRGVSALAMLAILLRDFEGTELWYEKAMELLGAHLDKEINSDGFQFERSVHYHISDIENYFFVYQLAKKSAITMDPVWENQLKSLFTTLVKIGFPNKEAPVLQDDTNRPWAETNDISNVMTLGYILFDDPQMGYFASNQVDARMFWYISDEQMNSLQNIEKEKPSYGSLSFPQTGYYIMREGWDENNKMMVISAGLDDKKPDHQHGDMLGVQLMANQNVLLPNYQVRYYLKDLELFKNSLVKNVALVNNQLQGKEYTSNKGGSGFGKFRKLPKPTTLTWETGTDIDLFVGSHNGFENLGVHYNRQVIYIKDDFWIVKDNFKSNTGQKYQQVWQGHYSLELAPELLRTTFTDGSGFDIYQLNKVDEVSVDGKRGKSWAITSTETTNNYSFATVLYPYKAFDQRISDEPNTDKIGSWLLNKAKGDYEHSFTKKNQTIILSAKSVKLKSSHLKFVDNSDVSIVETANEVQIQNLGAELVKVILIANGKILEQSELNKVHTIHPGKKIIFRTN